MDNLSFRLGVEVGESYCNMLPTLSCSDLCSNNVIQVTYGEAKELKRLTDIWYKNSNKAIEGNDPNWDAYLKYYRSLVLKYIPKEYKVDY